MAVKKEESTKQLQCLHGIRFLSMTWIMLIHAYTYGMHLYQMVLPEELTKSMYLMNDFAFQGVVQAAYGVDIFFLLSGTLVAHVLIQELTASQGKVSWAYFYIHRYWRLTPLLAIIQLFYTSIAQVFLRVHNTERENCKWWLSLLYINNVYKETSTCMSWTWYLANDMQFYMVSPFFIHTLWRWPKIGFMLVMSTMICSWTVSGAISWQLNLIPGYSQLTEATDFVEYTFKSGEYFLRLYIKPYGRIGPYLIGILLAYLIHRQKTDKRTIPSFIFYGGWCIAVTLGLVTVYGVNSAHPGKLAVCLYNSLSRSCFAASVAWIIFACLNGHGGIVNCILSHDWFVPVSRLTYSAYLIHPIFYITFYDGLRTPLYITHIHTVSLFFSCLVISYGIALAASVLFESPCMALEKMIMKKNS